jgi:hypothetical protein
MISQAFTVGTTAVQLVTTSKISREVSLHVTGNGVVYLGGSDVTSTNGMLTEKGAVPFTFKLPPNNELWAITASGTENVRVMTPANLSN